MEGTSAKYVKRVTIIIAVLALSVWVATRWHVWFRNVSDTPESEKFIPDRVTLTPGENFTTERTIAWRCASRLLPSAVQLVHRGDTSSIAAHGVIVENRGVKDAFYVVQLKRLSMGETYRYRVRSGKNASAWFSFVMPKWQPSRRFLYFGDVQDTIGGWSHAMFSKFFSKFRDVDFWACGGDLIERPINKYWNYLFQTTDSALASIPFINTVGNHDYIKGIFPKIDPRWAHTFAYPLNGPKRLQGRCYFIDFPDMRLLVLDTNAINDCITARSEYAWLQRALSEVPGKWKVVMMHHPIYSVRQHHNNFGIRNTFNPLFLKYGVHLVLQGHEHGYSRYIAREGASVGNHPVYIVSYASPKSYKAKQSVASTKIVPHRPMYQVVSYDNHTMTLTAYDLWTDRVIDEVKINRN